jgi:DNA adenine methylase
MKTLFRYPGSKAKFIPTLLPLLSPMIADSFTDAFVGGGSVALSIAAKFPNVKIVLNDKDYWIYSFWDLISSNSDLAELFRLINQQPTLELFYSLRKDTSKDKLFCAYKAIFFNRTAFSGILKSGPIGGKEQKSDYKIDCRYNATKLIKQIKEINKLLVNRTTVYNLDIIDLLELVDGAIYLDPPYFDKGKELYIESMQEKEHENLRNALAVKDNWLLSYDNAPEIRELYKDFDIQFVDGRYCINGKKDKWEDAKELLIKR